MKMTEELAALADDYFSQGEKLKIASHFHLVPGNDTSSFLLLGDG